MIYLIEKRHTVGAYRAIDTAKTVQLAIERVNKEIDESGENWFVPKNFKATEDIPFCVKAGTEHNNIMIRVRKIGW